MVVERDGVGVEKVLMVEKFDTQAVVFRVQCSRDRPAVVRVSDPLPAPLSPEDVALHPEYDSEGWGHEDGELRFERRLEPGERVETVYGLRVGEITDPEELLLEPTIDAVDAPDAGGHHDEDPTAERGAGAFADDGDDPGGVAVDLDDGPDPSGVETNGSGETDTTEADGGDPTTDDAVGGPGTSTGEADADAGEDESDAGPSGAATAATDDSLDRPATAGSHTGPGVGDGPESGETPEDPAGDESAASPAVGTDPEEGVASDDGPTVEPGDDAGETLAATLAAEFERGAVDPETAATLNEHLDATLAESTRVRIDDLSARVEEVSAYADAMESLLDRVGTDEDVADAIADLRGEVTELRAEVEADDGVDDAAVEGLREEVEELAADVEQLAELGETLADVEESVAELEAWREQLASSIAGVSSVTDEDA